MTQPITTLTSLATTIDGRWLTLPTDASASISGFSIDTRTLLPGDVFIALRSDKADGHDHLEAAAKAGAAAAIVSQPYPQTTTLPLLRVEDTLTALHKAAAAHRNAFNIPVVAVIGSNGKTTTRQMAHAALAAQRTGSQSPKSFNNHLGVPLTLLQVRPNHDFLVAELGTNHPGELQPLATLAQPTHLILTTLGSEHLEHFHNLAGVTAEETSALLHLQPPATIISSTQAWSVAQRQQPERTARFQPILYSDIDTSAPIHLIPNTFRQTATGIDFTASIHGQHIEITLPMLGRHNAFNVLAALAIAHELNVDPKAAANGLAHLPTVARRLEPIQLPNHLLIDDAYNANPESSTLAIDTFLHIPTSHRTIVLGDMLELGTHTTEAHLQILTKLARHTDDIQQLFLVGPHYAAAAQHDAFKRLSPVIEPEPSNDAITRITERISDKPGSILIKASLGLDFLRLRRAIEARFTSRTDDLH
ncbi:UDP-N-acetylmuramoyl-tripeptide--D-alanyl-D-alanine ligase [Mucisphaera sp.]|uniref:UDP-N-acetylmuramoyl-tripeptide--D-alanyl-D- alanine ligase n=1 Tax=Mucisphaera sp. TaxID=2913024 RepID=UPI003D0EF765